MVCMTTTHWKVGKDGRDGNGDPLLCDRALVCHLLRTCVSDLRISNANLVDLLVAVDTFLCEWRENLSTVCHFFETRFGRREALNIAASNGMSDVCDALLSSGRYERDHNASNSAPLCRAIYGGHLDTVRVLVEKHGADPLFRGDAYDGFQKAVIKCAEKGFAHVLQALLDYGCDRTFFRTSCHLGALSAGIYHGRMDTVCTILNREKQTESKHDDVSRAIASGLEKLCGNIFAFDRKEEENDDGAAMVLRYFVFREASISIPDAAKSELLPIACRSNNIEAVKVLLSFSGDAETKKETFPRCPGCPDVIPSERICDPCGSIIRNAKSKEEMTILAKADQALACACCVGDDAIADMLLTFSGADVHYEDDEALRCAAKRNRQNCVELLVRRGADVHARNDEALRIAAYSGNLSVVITLIENFGADVHALDDQPLRMSVCANRRDVVDVLLNRYGANVRASDDFALRWAPFKSDTDVIDILRNAYERIDRGTDVFANVIQQIIRSPVPLFWGINLEDPPELQKLKSLYWTDESLGNYRAH